MTGTSGQRSEGRPAIEKALAQAIGASKARKITLKETKLREFGDITVQNDAWEAEVVSQDDKTSNLTGRSTVVYQRTPKGWVIVDHHTALNPRN